MLAEAISDTGPQREDSSDVRFYILLCIVPCLDKMQANEVSIKRRVNIC